MKYKCGCESDGIIILDNNKLSIMQWLEWSETAGIAGTKEQCWNCWCKEELK